MHSRHLQVIWIQDKTGRVLRGLSHIPVPQMPAETSGEFLSHCLQISAGAHVQIVGEAIGTWLGRVIGHIQYFIFVLVRLTAIFLIPNTGSCFIVLQDTDREVATFLNRKFGGLIASIETVAKEDLDLVRFTFRVFRFGDSILSLEVSTL